MGKIVRALLDLDALVIAIDAKDIVERAKEVHTLTPVMCAVLGRTLTAGAIMGAQLKNEGDTLTMTINGGGPAGNVVVCADEGGAVRGYAQNPFVNLPPNARGKLDVSGAVGSNGFITVTKDIGLKEPYTGRTRLVSGEIAEDVTSYYFLSEQTPCAVALSVAVDADLSIKGAGGIGVFPLPGVSEKTLCYLEANLDALGRFAHLLYDTDVVDALFATFPGTQLEVLDEGEANYRCTCSVAKMTRALAALPGDDLTDMMEKDGGAGLSCVFCGSSYSFTRDDLQRIIASRGDA